MSPLPEVVTERYYSVSRLATMQLRGFPRSKKGWYELVAREGWGFREVDGQGGPAGKRREYLVPPNVASRIQQAELSDSYEAYRAQVAAGEPLATAKANFINDYNDRSPTVGAVDGLETITLDALEEALSQGAMIRHTASSGKTGAGLPLLAEAAEKGKRANVQAPAPYDAGRDLLEAVLRVGEYKILHNQVTKHVIEFGLEGAPTWLEAARDFPDLELRLRNMIATFKFIAAANEPPESGGSNDKPVTGQDAYSW